MNDSTKWLKQAKTFDWVIAVQRIQDKVDSFKKDNY